MEPTTPYSHEDDVDSTHSSNSTASDGTEREENNNNESQEETRTSRSPNEALDEIRRQQTHNLYCPKCKTNITKSAELVVKNQETDSYKTKAYVLWVPLVISPFEFPTLHLLLSFLTGLWKKLKTLVPNCLSRLSPNFLPLRYLLVAVLLLLSVIVLWSSDPPLPPPPPPYPSPLPPPPSPSPTPGPDSPLPSPGPDSPLPLPGPPPSPSPTPGPDSPLPSPGPDSPLPLPGPPPSSSPTPGPDSPLPSPGPPPSPSPTPGPDSPLPSPGPDSPLPSPGPDPPLPSPGPHLYEKNRWLIHFPSIKYLSVFSLLFLAILTLPWASISPIFNNLIAAIKTWSKRVIPQTFIKPQPRLSSTDKALGIFTCKITITGDHHLCHLSLTLFLIYLLKMTKTHLGAKKPSRLILSWITKCHFQMFCGNPMWIRPGNLIAKSKGNVEIYRGSSSKPLTNVEIYRGSSSKPLTKRARHLEEYCVRRSYRVHHKPRCRILRCRFRSFNSITDKGHYKAAVVLAASLVCVISLSFAKAYAFRMQKLRTMAEYTGMAFGASAFSFIASRIVSDIFEKFGFHELAAEYRKD
ncbi:putative proline-rich protein [Arabidopsis thaliana]|uniref:Glycine-rich protein family n=1 Tax=Arabidopsis thaliana TaxID=3702 RepID=Q9STP1_ARATH|nr:Glycine-rich protein family [Arabidopsis thaliana]AEE85400.1 Glycine-rich protein family [Arabidopsis thaliana]CAB43973.1 putative proline-rich protein [Arabidopsis thaliana]CAB81434.1 putative proline-rich protein [Arabidopsis thaliana]|eukprot:NP_194514.1 Glycine-rich protein family [Arabidopsis thaliana]